MRVVLATTLALGSCTLLADNETGSPKLVEVVDFERDHSGTLTRFALYYQHRGATPRETRSSTAILLSTPSTFANFRSGNVR
jgi:hypothetical protein